jgi:hypothetical protein
MITGFKGNVNAIYFTPPDICNICKDSILELTINEKFN